MSEEDTPVVGSVWVYVETGNRYTIICLGKLKYGYGNWHHSVTYQCHKTNLYFTRDETTFLEKFEKAIT